MPVIHCKASRGEFIKRGNTGKGIQLSIHLPDEILEDRETSEKFVLLALANARSHLQDGVFRGNPLHWKYD